MHVFCALNRAQITDFDIDMVLQKRKEESGGRSRRRKKDGDTDLINDHDGAISSLIRQMKTAAEVARLSFPLSFRRGLVSLLRNFHCSINTTNYHQANSHLAKYVNGPNFSARPSP